MNNFSQELRRLREEVLKLSREALANLSKEKESPLGPISVSELDKFERDERSPTPEAAARLVATLHLAGASEGHLSQLQATLLRDSELVKDSSRRLLLRNAIPLALAALLGGSSRSDVMKVAPRRLTDGELGEKRSYLAALHRLSLFDGRPDTLLVVRNATTEIINRYSEPEWLGDEFTAHIRALSYTVRATSLTEKSALPLDQHLQDHQHAFTIGTNLHDQFIIDRALLGIIQHYRKCGDVLLHTDPNGAISYYDKALQTLDRVPSLSTLWLELWARDELALVTLGLVQLGQKTESEFYDAISTAKPIAHQLALRTQGSSQDTEAALWANYPTGYLITAELRGLAALHISHHDMQKAVKDATTLRLGSWSLPTHTGSMGYSLSEGMLRSGIIADHREAILTWDKAIERARANGWAKQVYSGESVVRNKELHGQLPETIDHIICRHCRRNTILKLEDTAYSCLLCSALNIRLFSV